MKHLSTHPIHLIALLLALLFIQPVSAEILYRLSPTAVFAGTSFEEPTTGGQYTDTGDPLTDHALINNAGEAPVNYTSIGGEIGFSSFYFNTRNSTGLTDGDFVGVTNFVGTVGAYTDGTQGFQIGDPDGKMRVTFDAVSLNGESNPEVAIKYFLQETGWETDDVVRIWVVVDGGIEIDLLNTNGSDIDDLGIEGSWLTATANLNTYTTAILNVELDSNSASESIYLDQIEFRNGLVAGGCGDAATLISAVQGNGASSPLVGNTVEIEGLVVGDFQDANELNGFFIQEEIADFDADPATSEGVFVAEGSSTVDVAIGDVVRITGSVAENDALTVVSSPSSVLVCSSSNTVTAQNLTLPESTNGELEQYEGMLVSVTNEMTVAQNFFLGRYGQMTLSADGRLYNPTNQFLAGSAEAIALASSNARNLLILDDGQDVDNCGDNPDPVPYLGAPPPNVIRAGDTVTNLVGVIDFGQINSGLDGPCFLPNTNFALDYRLHPTTAPTFTAANPRPASPADVGGTLTVAAYNVLNYFNGDGQGGGFPTSRGADTLSEFNRQRDKIIAALITIDADIVGLMEIENDGFDTNSAIADLVNGLNASAGAGTYAFVDGNVASIGTDQITVGMIYKPASVTLVGTAQILDSAAFTDPNGTGTQKSRPALAQTFEEISSGERLTVVVNHFKSKGSSCGAGDDDTTTGQGNCNGTRTGSAQALINWLMTDPTGSGDSDYLVIGDLNAYAMEDPITAFKDVGYTDLIRRFMGDTAYSYIFDGQSGYLDHALANASLATQVTGTTEWHINTDEAAVFNYDEDFNPAGYYSADSYRSSDHDPVIIGLDLGNTVTAVSVSTVDVAQSLTFLLIVAVAMLAGATATVIGQVRTRE